MVFFLKKRAPVVCRAEAVDDVELRPDPGAHPR